MTLSFPKLRKKLADFFFGLFKPPAVIDPFQVPLRPEEVEVVRFGSLLISVQIRGHEPYYLDDTERYCPLVFDESQGQYYIVRKVLDRNIGYNRAKVEVRELHNLQIRITTLPLHLTEKKA